MKKCHEKWISMKMKVIFLKSSKQNSAFKFKYGCISRNKYALCYDKK